MHSRRDVETTDEVMFPIDFDVRENGEFVVSELKVKGARGSSRKSCTAKRSIERLCEEQHLRELISDDFNDSEWDYAELDAD